MKTTVEEITPETAKEYLGGNTRNRPLSKHYVKRLARVMNKGDWKLNGDTICFNGKTLIDGQHRLAACVESKKPFKTLVVRGVDGDSFDTKDCGKRRGAPDTLALLGYKNSVKIAASLAFIGTYYNIGVINNKSARYTNIEVEKLIQEHPEVVDSVRKVLSYATKKTLITPSLLGALHYLFSRKDREMADEFIDSIMRGLNLGEDDPEQVLRSKLIQNSMDSNKKMSQEYIAAITVKTWNAKRKGQKIQGLRYNNSGIRAESFPLIN